MGCFVRYESSGAIESDFGEDIDRTCMGENPVDEFREVQLIKYDTIESIDAF